MSDMNNDDNLIPVADTNGRPISGLYKSGKTGAIVAEKNTEYQRYLRERENLKKVHSLTDEVDTLKAEMDELKAMIRENLQSGKNE